jgi:hypothetical protein
MLCYILRNNTKLSVHPFVIAGRSLSLKSCISICDPFLINYTDVFPIILGNFMQCELHFYQIRGKFRKSKLLSLIGTTPLSSLIHASLLYHQSDDSNKGLDSNVKNLKQKCCSFQMLEQAHRNSPSHN